MTHMPFTSWCHACVEEKARDKHHRKVEGQVDKEVPIVFDCCFLGQRERILSIVLECDGEPVPRTIQVEVQRPENTILENSPVGDSWAAERAVQAIAEQVRVIRRGLEQRLELRLSGRHGMAGGACGRPAVEVPSCRRWQDWTRTLERETREHQGQGQAEQFVGTRVTTWVVGGAQARPLSGHVLAFYVLVPCAALELIVGGTEMVLNMSVVYFGSGMPRRATSIPI